MTTVVNIKAGDEWDVNIMRPSYWGNPFQIGPDGDRAEVIRKHREYLKARPLMIERAKSELKGLRLGCCCKPSGCHGDNLADAAEGRL